MAGTMQDGLINRGTTSAPRWYYVVRVTDLETGKRKPKWVGPHPTKKAAKAARDAARHATHRGTYVEPSRLTLGQWLTRWLDNYAGSVRASTHDSYSRLVRLYVLPHPIAQQQLQALTPSQLTQHWRMVHKQGGVNGKPTSVRTVQYAHTVVGRALKAAVRDRQLEVNPATGVDLPKPQTATQRAPKAWTPDALRSFLADTEGHRLWPLWVLMAHTGLRRGEALALRWSEDVDLDAGRVKVQQSVADVGSGPVYGDPKNGEHRTVPLPAVVREALASWRKVQAAEKLAGGPAYLDRDGLVFTMPDGRPVYPGYATKAFGELVRETGAPTLTLHGLRHTAATLLLRDGHSVHLVAKLLGHRDISVTLNTYSHALPDDDTTLAEALQRIIAG